MALTIALHVRLDLAHQLCRLCSPGLWQDDCELVAPGPIGLPPGTNPVSQDIGTAFQQLVSPIVPHGIINQLQTVHICGYNGDRVSPVLLELPQPGFKISTVIETGDRIMSGQVDQLRFRLFSLFYVCLLYTSRCV